MPFYLDQQARELQQLFYVLYQPSAKVTEASGHTWLLCETRVLGLVLQARSLQSSLTSLSSCSHVVSREGEGELGSQHMNMDGNVSIIHSWNDKLMVLHWKPSEPDVI